MKFIGFEIKNFRSIGEEWVRISPFTKINILIGKNNSGKSNIIKGLQKIKHINFSKPLPGGAYKIQIDELEYHKRKSENVFGIKLIFDPSVIEEYQVKVEGEIYFLFEGNTDNLMIIDYFLLHQPYHVQRYFFESWSGRIPLKNEFDIIKKLLLKNIVNFFPRLSNLIPEISLVPQFREIKGASGELGLSGENLIGNLREWQIPLIGKENNRDKFDKIEKLVTQLIHLPKAKIEIPPNENVIYINDSGFRLPLDSYGTGVHEITILATAVTTLNHSICCIEEPEIHLHPELQKEFITYISNETTNTYFITTHSNAFIDLPVETQLFHARLISKTTKVTSPINSNELSAAVVDLGYKASDIIQSNGIIWVEGPSDRIYVNRWIELFSDNKWVEGKNYLIMFYGGRLLSNLTLNEDDDVDNFIELLKINRNAIVVMDSDKKKSSERVNKTKKRIKEECENNGSLSWITHGREIENYLDDKVISEVISEIVVENVEISLNQYNKIGDTISKRLRSKEIDDINFDGNKIKFANLLAGKTSFEHIDSQLKKILSKIDEKLLEWNG